MVLIKNDVDMLQECEFLKNDENCQCLEIKNVSMEQIEGFLMYIKNEEEVKWKIFE